MAATMSPWPGRKASKPKVVRSARSAAARSAMMVPSSNVLYLFHGRFASAKQRCGGVSCAIAPADAPWRSTPGFLSMTSTASRDGLPVGRLIKLMFVLWLAGVAMRMTILAMPPVIPQVHDELHMSETQVGLLIGLPLSLFAIAAVPR